MALVLRSNSDLICLMDHGFSGRIGAASILYSVQPHIHRIDVSHNMLEADGVDMLVKGLTTKRAQFSGPAGVIWGIKELNLGMNHLNDEAFAKVLEYAKKDVMLRKLWVQGNELKLETHLDSILNSLNSSHIEVLSMNHNDNITGPSLQRFLDRLNGPHLKELFLSTCNIAQDCTQALVRYLSSGRSRNLERFELNGNTLGAEAVTTIVDAVEMCNFSIQNLGLFANHASPQFQGIIPFDDADGGADQIQPPVNTPRPWSEEEKKNEERILSYQVHERLPVLLVRNRVLTRRVRRAALCAIAPSRIMLNARPLNDDEQAEDAAKVARHVISNLAPSWNGSNSSAPPSSTSSGVSFPLLDLPREVIYLVARHCSRDPSALSEAQFGRLRKEAEDRKSIARSASILFERTRKAEWGMEKEAEMEAQGDWLRRGGWDKWDLDVAVSPVLQAEQEQA